jgi:hypothetical protein
MKLIAVGLFAGVVGLACSAPLETETTVSETALSVLEAKEGRLVLSYKTQGRAIRYELLLGPKMETQEAPADPEEPTYQVDARVLDAEGREFFMQMGGDTFLDASWQMKPLEGFDEAVRVRDIARMHDALDDLRALAVPDSLVELKKAAIQIGRSVDRLEEKPNAPVTVEAEEGPALGTKTVSISNSYAYKWDYVIRQQYSGWFNWDHSAVQLRGWSSGGSVVGYYNSCNHGACSNYSSMATKCVMSGWRYDNGTRRRYFYSEPSGSTGTRYGGCSTPWGVTGATHFCNGDSILQRNAIYYNTAQDTFWGPYGWCAAPQPWAPGCH